MTSMRAMLGRRQKIRGAEGLFCLLYALSVWIGALISPGSVWRLADAALGIMTIFNLIVLLMMHREVSEETKAYLAVHTKKEKHIQWKDKKHMERTVSPNEYLHRK